MLSRAVVETLVGRVVRSRKVKGTERVKEIDGLLASDQRLAAVYFVPVLMMKGDGKGGWKERHSLMLWI